MLRTALILFLVVCGSVSRSHAGATPYTDRGKTDFDTFIKALDPYGTWKKTGQFYQFYPKKPTIPMSNGRWIYCDWGWFFLDTQPIGWATNHYGAWTLDETGVWAWRPDGVWHSDIVEWRRSGEYIGWRPCPLDAEHNFIETEERRYSRPEEWTFLLEKKLKGSFTSADVITGARAKELLENSENCTHTFNAWQDIDRPGPDPARYMPSIRDDGTTGEPGDVGSANAAVAVNSKGEAKSPIPPIPSSAPAPAEDSTVGNPFAAPAAAPKKVVEEKPAAPAPPPTSVRSLNNSLLNAAMPDKIENLDVGAHEGNKPKFAYFVLMSLPAFDTPVPSSAKLNELYVYRPAVFQDADGIIRRIEIFLNPNSRDANRRELNNMIVGGVLDAPGATNAGGKPPKPVEVKTAAPIPPPKATPATPAHTDAVAPTRSQPTRSAASKG